ncbi:hypothetical protein OIU74_025805 [Salix koriyanagi]|uniref:Uncharacterized protein n=1 Tax=Salix koriyanagi TaxID=2511006 RepID=A0A9Q1A602_9ROSI|nr:hypothetical protein OIU74_025805 [Salix koriyanagi]
MAVYNWESKKIYLFLSSTRSFERDLRQHKPRHERRDGRISLSGILFSDVPLSRV